MIEKGQQYTILSDGWPKLPEGVVITVDSLGYDEEDGTFGYFRYDGKRYYICDDDIKLKYAELKED